MGVIMFADGKPWWQRRYRWFVSHTPFGGWAWTYRGAKRKVRRVQTRL